METPEDDSRPTPALVSADNRRSGSPAVTRGWQPLGSWKLRQLYGALLRAVRSIVEPIVSARSDATPKILQIGGAPNILRLWLGAGDSPIDCAVEYVPSTADRIGGSPESVDCLVAIDWLPVLAASQRERAVADACRMARSGVIFVNAFESDAARTASRAINDLHRAVHGGDHPVLGRALELGLPDAGTVQRWLEPRFPFVHVAAVDDAAVWQAAEALAITSQTAAPDASDADIAAAATYPTTGDAGDPSLAFRSMIVGSHTPTGLVATPREPASSWSSALAIHHALEAAAQRRSLDALVAAVTTEREREREEFRAALASLAAELRELDGRAEFLAREIRARDTTIGNQQVLLEAAEERAAEAHAAETRALEAHAAAAQAAETHAAHARAAETRAVEAIAEASRVVGDQTAEREIAMLRQRLAAAEHDADAYRRFLASRAGRTLQRYTRIKNLLRRP